MNYFLELVGGQCMNDYRGLLIKKQRKELDISLEALSHGVCSPSYLSKIENNILVANDDIYNLLFKKLGISTMDTIKEEKIKQMLDLFFKYYMSSDSKIFKVMDELLEYKDEVLSSCLFIQYQLFLLYASEMNSQINISLAEVEAYYSYMDDSQREYFNLFRLSSGNMELSDNEEWIFIRRLKAKANLYAYQKNTFAAYDLYKTCLNYAIELGNKKLIAEILCSLGWLCLDIDLNQFSIQILPFETDDENERYKVVTQKINDFIGELKLKDPGLGKQLFKIWKDNIFTNGSKKDVSIVLSKKDLIWPIIVVTTDLEKIGNDFEEICEEVDYDEIVRQYKSFIDTCCEQVEIFTKIVYDFNIYKVPNSEKGIKKKMGYFLKNQWKNYVSIFTNDNMDADTSKGLTQAIIYSILKRRYEIDRIKNGVNL